MIRARKIRNGPYPNPIILLKKEISALVSSFKKD
jgi:hypothetical protein